MKGYPDATTYQFKKQRLRELIKLEDSGQIDLLFCDETGFNLMPYIPYGWQPIGEQISIRSAKDRVCNLLGFLNRQGSLKVYSTPQNINSDFVIECLDEVSSEIQIPTVVVMDNAPWHCSAKVKSKEKEWNDKGLYLFFLPTYSPHLNIIEILWRKIKYQWLKAEDYLSAKSLKEAVHYIISKYDDEYSINFSKNLFA